MMAYKYKDLEQQALEAINKYKFVFIEEVVTKLPCSKRTFYELNLHESHSIKEAIEKNKIDIKAGLRKKWYESDNATVQIALYKLIGTEEETDRINSQKVKYDGEMRQGFHINLVTSEIPFASNEDEIEGGSDK